MHAELLGDETRVLARRAAEALEGEVADVVPLLERHFFDSVCHVRDSNAQKACGGCARVVCRSTLCVDASCERGEAFAHNCGVYRQVACRTENMRKMLRLNLANADIGIGDGQRTAAPIAGGTGIGARALGADAKTRAVIAQNRAAAGRHAVNRHHRCAHAHACDLGIEGALERAGIHRHVRRRAAHVKPNDVAQSGPRGGARGADDAGGGPGQYRILTLKGHGINEPAV